MDIPHIRYLYIVRHCQATGQQPAAPLTDAGQVQAQQLAEHFAPLGIELIVASPLLRAQQSIVPLAQRLGLAVGVDLRLAERVLSTAPLDDWRAALGASFDDLDLAWPGGESSRGALARGRAAVDDVLSQPAHAAVIVTHGNLMTLILRSFASQFGFAAWEQLSNPDVYRITIEQERTVVERTWV